MSLKTQTKAEYCMHLMLQVTVTHVFGNVRWSDQPDFPVGMPVVGC